MIFPIHLKAIRKHSFQQNIETKGNVLGKGTGEQKNNIIKFVINIVDKCSKYMINYSKRFV